MATVRTLVPPCHHSDAHIDPRGSTTEVFVANSNLALATTNPKDPYTIYADTSGGADRAACHIIGNEERFPWLELWPVIPGASLPAADVIVRPFGIIPFMPQSDQSRTAEGLDRFAPFDADSTKFPVFLGPDGKTPIHIVPLRQLGSATYAPLTFDHLTSLVDATLSLRNITMPPLVVYTGGAPKIMVTTDTASSVAGSILCGRFTN